jgi:glutathione S-transferase
MSEQQKELLIWGVGTTRTLRVHWLLAELGVTYKTKAIGPRTGETKTSQYTSLNPKQKIPVLVHGDLVLSESFAIMKHLRRSFDVLEYDAYQGTEEGLCRYDEIATFCLMELDATSLYVIRRHEGLPEIYGESSTAVSSARAYFLRMIKTISMDTETPRFIWGNTFSELDILLTINLDWATAVGIHLPDNLIQYCRWIHQRPGYKNGAARNSV